MAGGDGSQAVVAAVAAERGLPYACIPAGTRNHFALDLGVDRDDVVGALDAFVDGGEPAVDLAEVNGGVLVNNVSLGLFAEAVQRDGIATPSCAPCSTPSPTSSSPPAVTRWTCTGPGPGGHDAPMRRRGAGLQQRLPARPRGRLRTRPRIDDGLFGITAVAKDYRTRQTRRSPQRPCASRPRQRSTSTRTDRSRRHRRRGAGPRRAAALLFGPASFACASPASTPARHRRRWYPKGRGPAWSSGAHRPRPPETPRQHPGDPNGPDRDHRKERLGHEDAVARLTPSPTCSPARRGGVRTRRPALQGARARRDRLQARDRDRRRRTRARDRAETAADQVSPARVNRSARRDLVSTRMSAERARALARRCTRDNATRRGAADRPRSQGRGSGPPRRARGRVASRGARIHVDLRARAAGRRPLTRRPTRAAAD